MKERTVALEQANEQLRVEIGERERAEERRERALIEQRDTLAFLAAVSEGLAPVLTLESWSTSSEPCPCHSQRTGRWSTS